MAGMTRIHLIATGGTIEKVYHEQTGTVQNMDSKISRYFRLLRLPDTEIEVTHLMNKDSLEMTEADRRAVLETVRQKLADPAPVVITHGTDTMVETGLLLKSNLPDLNVPIVMTGAMTPLGFEGSDGLARGEAQGPSHPVGPTERLARSRQGRAAGRARRPGGGNSRS